jgi:hypothetical protein
MANQQTFLIGAEATLEPPAARLDPKATCLSTRLGTGSTRDW